MTIFLNFRVPGTNHMQSDSGSWGRTGNEVVMVSKSSAQLFGSFEERIPVPANHTDIVKFPSREYPTYRTLVRCMKNCIESIGKQTAILVNEIYIGSPLI